MNSLSCVYCFTLVVVATVAQDGAHAQQAKDKPPIEKAADAIDQALKLKAESYHVFLREAALIVPPVLRGQNWSEIQGLMKTKSFSAIEAWDNGDFMSSYHIVKRKAFVFHGGHSLDLCLLLSARTIDPPTRPGLAGKLRHVDIALVAEISEPYERVVGEKRYPKGSVLDAILTSKYVKEVGEIWPLLKRVYVYYGYLDNRWEDYSPSGFIVTVDFVASDTESIAGKKMSFRVASGLDPRQSRDGKEQPSKRFKPHDSVGEIWAAGGNEWWYGEPEVVQANKNKYLKTKQ